MTIENQMVLSKPQAFLIKKICDLQCNSLDEIIINPNLGEDRELILANHGLTRKDFDEATFKSRREFQKVVDNPEYLYKLSYEGLLVSLFILIHIKDEYSFKWPNAIENMRIKLSNLLLKIEKERNEAEKN